MNITFKEISRFYSKTRKSGDCILWTGKPDTQGYGRMLVGTRSILAHHIAFWLKYKAEPTQYVIHTCDNKLCVNPQHLIDGPNKGRPPKISKTDIKLLYEKGHKPKEIAIRLNCSVSLVRRNIASGGYNRP